MTLLVLDTATDRCALALSLDAQTSERSGHRTVENTRSIPRAHNEHMLQMLDDLFATAHASPRDLTAIGFAAGPGSFTGIRISAAAAQALAVAAGAQVLPVSSSRLLAAAALRQFTQDGLPPDFPDGLQELQTVLRSRRNYIYVASFAVVGSASDDVSARLMLKSDDVLLEDAALVERALPAGCLRVMASPDTGPNTAKDPCAAHTTPVDVAITDLLALARADLAQGLGLPPEGAQPRYVEGDTPWQPRVAGE